MPFLMELDDAIPMFLKAIENKQKFAAFPWQLAAVVRAGNKAVKAVQDLTGGGVHHSFEAIGLKVTAEQAFRMLRRAARPTSSA